MEQICEPGEKRARFSINDNVDLLVEILKRLDDRSLGLATGVCRLWRGLLHSDALWEHLCFRQLAPAPEGVRTVVEALGGYRRLYMACVKPVLSRLGRTAAWTQHEVALSLSLFCVDYYERVLVAGGGGRAVGEVAEAPTPSLMFLCGAVAV